MTDALIAQEANSVWEAVRGDLQIQLTKPSYETWFSGTRGLTYSDHVFVVGAPNAFVSEMLDQRMYGLVAKSLAKVTGKDLDVKFEVMNPLFPGVGQPNPPAADRLAGSGTITGSTRIPNKISTLCQLNPKYRFETFIVGNSNELAHAAALAVSEKPAFTYNPLVIYSGVGLGKTHLLQAIGHRIVASGLSTIYSTTEEFTNDYINAIRRGKTEEFRHLYRSADVLLLDDIQFLIGKEQTQEGFFHTFNALHMAGKQIVITSDRPVSSLTLLEDRVSSRLAGGLVVDIQPPGLETRMAILKAKADESSQHLPYDVLQFIAERLHRNVRDLEGSLNRVSAYALLAGCPVTIDLVKSALSDTLRRLRSRNLSDKQVLDTVSGYFSIDHAAIVGKRRDKNTALARQVAMYLLREEMTLPYNTIGRIFGGKDHTTVLHACKRIAAKLDVDSHLHRDVINIRDSLSKASA